MVTFMGFSMLMRASILLSALSADAGAQSPCSSTGKTLWSNLSLSYGSSFDYTVVSTATHFVNVATPTFHSLTIEGALYFDCNSTITLTCDFLSVKSTGRLEI